MPDGSLGECSRMGKGKDHDAHHRSARSGSTRAKELRRELRDLEVDLEHARVRRDKAQARLEALEAIAEQLGGALAAAMATDAARDARRHAADAAAQAVSAPAADADADAATGSGASRPGKVRKRQPAAEPPPDEGPESIDLE